MPRSTVPVMALRTACSTALTSASTEVPGSGGTVTSGGAFRDRAEVRSPVTPRRQADRLGTATPNRVSMNLSVDVWSNTSEHT